MLIEEMIFDIDYILENTFDEIVKLLIINPYDVLDYNKQDVDLFWTYTTFCCAKGNNIRLEKEFKETKILNLFHLHRHDTIYINETKKLIIKLNNQENYLSALPKFGLNKYYYNLKEKLIYIRDILLPLYILTNKH